MADGKADWCVINSQLVRCKYNLLATVSCEYTKTVIRMNLNAFCRVLVPWFNPRRPKEGLVPPPRDFFHDCFGVVCDRELKCGMPGPPFKPNIMKSFIFRSGWVIDL